MLNRYPLWKNILIFGIVILSTILALPNLYGEDPSVQISAKPETTLTTEMVENLLAERGFNIKRIDSLDSQQLLVRFRDPEEQLNAKDYLDEVLSQEYTTALNLAPDMPKWLSTLGLQPMYLGLDLRGGVHFLLEIDMEALVEQLTNSYVGTLRDTMAKERLNPTIEVTGAQNITLHFTNEEGAAQAAHVLRRNPSFQELEVTLNRDRLHILVSDHEINERKRSAVTQNITTLRNRVNELGVAEPIIQQQGVDRIVVQLPGIQDTARAKEILGSTATLQFRMVDERRTNSPADLKRAIERRAPLGTELLYTRDGRPMLLHDQVILTGDSIISASAGFNPETNGPEVYIRLDSKGADRFGAITKENVGNLMATVFIENKVHYEMVDGVAEKRNITTKEIANAAVIRSQLFDRFSISGLDSIEEANNLAITLSSGALAAPIHIIEERTVGPSAGKENIDRGMNAALFGLIMVMLFMAVRYRAFGIVADIALFANLILILAALSLLQATLTLPGIAGIVLSLGMSVDANVLINERIREDLRKGVSPQNAIDAGFGRAFATIMDANLTSLFAALALFYVGSGPIKGFAVTLSIGIITSIFTAVYFNRALINFFWGGRRLSKLPIGGRERLKIFSGETTYDFMRLCKFWVISCIMVIVAAIAIISIKGFNYGLDFTGGTEVVVEYEHGVEMAPIYQQLDAAEIDATAQLFGKADTVLISMATDEDADSGEISDLILDTLQNEENPLTIQRIDFIGSKVGDELVTGGVIASTIAVLLILAYIWIRFEWKLAVGSILSTIHDALFVIAFFSLAGLTFDLTSLAAILAVIGYSVNDTVVVLDRIRENFRKLRHGTPYEIVNASINQTLSRTIMTSITTFLAVLALYIFGGAAIESFSLIMLIGIAVGTYSSIFVAAAGALILGLKREDLLPPSPDKEKDGPLSYETSI